MYKGQKPLMWQVCIVQAQLLWENLAKTEVHSLTHLWGNRGHPKRFWQSLYTTMLIFLPKKLMAFCLDGPDECTGQIWSPYLYRSWDNSAYLKTLGSPWRLRSRLFKVTDFGLNGQRVCDFLLVRNSNLGAILHRFADIAGFLALRSDPTHIPPKFGGCSSWRTWPTLGSAREQRP